MIFYGFELGMREQWLPIFEVLIKKYANLYTDQKHAG